MSVSEVLHDSNLIHKIEVEKQELLDYENEIAEMFPFQDPPVYMDIIGLNNEGWQFWRPLDVYVQDLKLQITVNTLLTADQQGRFKFGMGIYTKNKEIVNFALLQVKRDDNVDENEYNLIEDDYRRGSGYMIYHLDVPIEYKTPHPLYHDIVRLEAVDEYWKSLTLNEKCNLRKTVYKHLEKWLQSAKRCIVCKASIQYQSKKCQFCVVQSKRQKIK